MKSHLRKELSELLDTQECIALCAEDAKCTFTNSTLTLPKWVIDPEDAKFRNTVRKVRDLMKPIEDPKLTKADREKKAKSSRQQARDICNNIPLDSLVAIRDYVQANSTTYYLLLNTWYHLVYQFSSNACVMLDEMIHTMGVLATISVFAEAADAFIRDEILPPTLSGIYSEICKTFAQLNRTWRSPSLGYESPEAAMLLVMRYPKRFSPSAYPVTESAAKTTFMDVNRRCRLFDRTFSINNCIIKEYVKEEIAHLLNWRTLCSRIRRVTVNPRDWCLPNGSTSCGKDGYDKILYSYGIDRMLYNPIFGWVPDIKDDPPKQRAMKHSLSLIYGQDLSATNGTLFNHVPALQSSLTDDRLRDFLGILPSHIRFVPKTYKTARTIAMESPFKYSLAKQVANLIDAQLPPCIPLHDQSVHGRIVSQFWEQVASIDSSSASDSITKMSWKELFPEEFVSLVDPLLPSYYSLGDTRKTLYGFATSGNPLTFILESIFFAGIVRAAIRAVLFFGRKFSRKEFNQILSTIIYSIYGDDILIQCEYAETVVDFLQALNIQVNASKSFGIGSDFRESCGYDVLQGDLVTTFYWPRKTFNFSEPKSLLKSVSEYDSDVGSNHELFITSLIRLQQRMYPYCPTGAQFLCDWLTTNYKIDSGIPGATANLPYSPTYSMRTTQPYGKYSGPLEGTVNDPSIRLSGRYPAPDAVAYGPGEHWPDVWVYTQYLLFGPHYEDDFMRLLGISSSRRNVVSYTTAKFKFEVI